MLIPRVLTTLAALPALIVLLRWGSLTLVSLFMGLVTLVGLWEYGRLVRSGGGYALKAVGAALALGIVFVAYAGNTSVLFGRAFPLVNVVFGLASVSAILWMIFVLFSSPGGSAICSHPLSLVVGPAVLGLLLSHVVLLMASERGRTWILLLLVIVWLGDTGAYVFGKWLGRHPLYAAVSPKKTVEGSLGGLACSVAGGVVANMFFLQVLSLPHCLILSFCLGVLGQLGDLFESLVKRSVGEKDSGRLLPGHGGLLDRIDSLLFAAPFLYYYTLIMLPGRGVAP